MNWALLGILIIVLMILMTFIIAAIAYIRHWARRHEYRLRDDLVTEGIYFKRYITPSLYEKYDSQKKINKKLLSSSIGYLKFVISGMFILLTITMFIVIVYVNFDKLLYTDIDLSQNEVSNLDYVNHNVELSIDKTLPSMEDVLSQLKKKTFVVISSRKDTHWNNYGTNLTIAANEQWDKFFNNWDFSYKHCHWDNINRCANNIGNTIFIVLPGYWDYDNLDKLLDQNSSLIVYGPPAQLYTADTTTINWNGLRFNKQIHNDAEYLAIRGDQKLTLGFDAGLIVALPAAFQDYYVTSDNPQAISISSDRQVGGVIKTRLYASDLEHGRFVWMDYAPDSDDNYSGLNERYLNAINASIFRYLLKMEYSSWATWPDGATFAGFIAEDTEDKFSNAKEVTKLVIKHEAPITWFILSNQAKQNRSLVNEMAETGEIACHGDNHVPFPNTDLSQQVIRLARCKKVLGEITGKEVTGFRPPEERYNDLTISALFDNKLDHFFGGGDATRGVPFFEISSDSIASIVSIPRMITDDYEMWHTNNLSYSDSIALIDNEIRWIEELGGIYSFSFHTQFMDSEERIKIVEHVIKKLKSSDCYFANVKEIAEWWRFRDKLQSDKKADKSLLKVYKPKLLTVSEDGKLTTNLYHQQ